MRFQVRDELSFRATCGSACTNGIKFDILNKYLFIPLMKSTCLSLVILSRLKDQLD